MFRRITMLAALVLAVNTVSYAQDAATESSPVYKTLGIYICGGTGNINPAKYDGKNLAILENWSEYGITYSQNISSAPWLGINTSLVICTESTGLEYDATLDKYTTVPNNSSGDGLIGNNVYLSGVGQVNLAFGDYVSVDFRTSGRIDLNLQYSYSWGETYKQRIRFRTYLDMHPTGTELYITGADAPVASSSVVAEFQGRVDYNLAFHKNFSFNTELRLYSGGDTSDDFRDNFSIRWNNTLSKNAEQLSKSTSA